MEDKQDLIVQYGNGDGYARVDKYDGEVTEKIVEHYAEILKLLNEDPNREGLQKTPQRVAKSM